MTPEPAANCFCFMLSTLLMVVAKVAMKSLIQ
jgi:hypothetical protein